MLKLQGWPQAKLTLRTKTERGGDGMEGGRDEAERVGAEGWGGG